MEDAPLPLDSTQKDWCAIISAFIVSLSLCFVGVYLMASRDTSTGLVLVFINGSLLILTGCAALGKYRVNDKEEEDRPPSYRISWRRSFMRRTRQTNNQKDTPQPESVPQPPSDSTQDVQNNTTEFNASVSSMEMGDMGVSTLMPYNSRQTRSLDNLIDPPSYEDVLMTMDETTKRKLKSELCLPSCAHF